MDAADALGRLQELLLQPEREALRELREKLESAEVTAEDVGRVLPDAIVARAGQDELLANALTPTIENALEVSVRRNPSILTDLIFPVIGPAIRKSIAQSMAALSEAINRSVEYSLSPKGLRWRLEGWRTGVPFSEIILKHSLVFRVEQVILIHRNSAVLLEHVIQPSVASGDPDMISAMLGAIQDFVSDSFEDGESGAISQIEFGDRVLEVARGPTAVLACEVRGIPTADLREQMQEALEAIHAARARELREFNGDVAPFLSVRPLLEGLVLEQRAERKPNKLGPIILACGAALAIVLAALWISREYTEHREWTRGRIALREEPGVVLLTDAREGRRLVYGGLLDPLASDPVMVLREAGVSVSRIDGHWAPFHSLEPEIVQRRFVESMSPPETVTFELLDQKVTLRGSADHAWIMRVKDAIGLLPGVESLGLDELIDADLLVAQKLVTEIEALSIPFRVSSSEIEEGLHEVGSLLGLVGKLERLSLETGIGFQLEVLGLAAANRPELLSLADARAGALERRLGETSSHPAGLSFIRTRPSVNVTGEADTRLRVHLNL